MIDISNKNVILRIATASGKVFLKSATIKRVREDRVEKGDVLTIARIAGTNAVKKVPDLIPLCHPIGINSVDFGFEVSQGFIKVMCTVKSFAKTGVEMEALTGVSTALLNIWDVVKMYEKDEHGQYPNAKISEIKVDKKIKKPNK
ncbi:MAG: cyclic pyranopterin monophosphate synthase MoaC [Promethearchaeia archaeon]